MLSTPNTSHVAYDRVYEPSEDSFLVLDTLSEQGKFLTQRFEAHNEQAHAVNDVPLIVEAGSGSGVSLSFAAMHAKAILGREDILAVGIDVNPFACEDTQRTMRRNGARQYEAYAECIQGDLASAVRKHSIDVLIFNPPYVPSEALPDIPCSTLPAQTHVERHNAMLALATDGGELGMETTNRLLDQLPDVLSKSRGVAYVLLCAQNKPEQVMSRLRGWGTGWEVEVVGASGGQGGWERLQIIRIART